MIEKIGELLHKRVIRLIVIESLIFALVAVFSLATGFKFSMGLTAVGAVLLVLQFSGGRYRIDSRGMGSYTFEKQVLKDVQKQQPQRAFALMNELTVISLIPLVTGLLLEFIT